MDTINIELTLTQIQKLNKAGANTILFTKEQIDTPNAKKL